MDETFFPYIALTGFVVALAHAAIPTHWLPFVIAARGQRWSKVKTSVIVVLCGSGHVLFTTLLGVLVVWLGIETSRWAGNLFPKIAGSALIFFGLYYLVRQMRGGGHGHGHAHHDHGSEAKRVVTRSGILLLEVFEDGVPPRFRVRAEGSVALPHPRALTVETLRPDGGRQTFAFADHDGYLESLDEIPEPHEFSATLSLSHGDQAERHVVRFEENHHGAAFRSAGMVRSDGAVILSLFTFLTFSPCEGFLPVYVSGIRYGWVGFVVLSAVLAVATVAGMTAFTWLTMTGIERLRLEFLERYESGILGAFILLLGIGIIFLGF